MKKSLLWTAIGASFIWMAFVYASFYLVPEQRPLDAARLQAIGGTLLDLLAAAFVLLLGAGIGWRISRWLKLTFAVFPIPMKPSIGLLQWLLTTT